MMGMGQASSGKRLAGGGNLACFDELPDADFELPPRFGLRADTQRQSSNRGLLQSSARGSADPAPAQSSDAYSSDSAPAGAAPAQTAERLQQSEQQRRAPTSKRAEEDTTSSATAGHVDDREVCGTTTGCPDEEDEESTTTEYLDEEDEESEESEKALSLPPGPEAMEVVAMRAFGSVWQEPERGVRRPSAPRLQRRGARPLLFVMEDGSLAWFHVRGDTGRFR
jgi:hypothetical protein